MKVKGTVSVSVISSDPSFEDCAIPKENRIYILEGSLDNLSV